ncbi:type VI secretion system ImpA family N-terminal domain-containing protein [Novosphingobium sp.]|uniref:type VI secretion system protein TssA n=1 Tax=Novosphingobium sp. TaxID=1874826 RepID=UPI003340E5CC
MLLDEEICAAILEPIDGSVGIDGREDEGDAADLLRELRSQRKALVRLEQAAAMADDGISLPEGAWDWERIGESAIEYLTRYGKDLEAMAILIEATARSDGLGDIASALELLADLVDAFWDQGMYPAEDDDDGVAARFQPLSGLSGGSQEKEGALIGPLRRVRIAPSGLRLIDKVRADVLMEAAQSLTDSARSAKVKEAESLLEAVQTVARTTPASVLTAAAATAARMEAAWRRAIAAISERTKPRYPAASRLTDDLRLLSQWLAGFAPAAAPEAGADDGAAAVDSGGATGAESAAPQGGFVAGRITRREDALKAIEAAANFFLIFEPLSPLGATLREVDRRARMTMDDLLVELIPDDSSRKEFYWRSGIKPPEKA